jgi:Flp pilus assembly protein TadG
LRRGSRGNYEHGVVITLVAVFILFVVGAMAALSIDVVTIYTARSEAQLAADGAALAAARVLANSGATSDPNSLGDGVMTTAQTLASAIATQVAEQNQVGGVNLTGIPAPLFGGTSTNPTVTVSVQVTNLPTFFARIWGTKFIAVSASATAEAYNPSGANLTGTTIPVAPICVKPWLLPNIDPSNPPNPIFATTTGAINDPALLGWTFTSPGGVPMSLACPGGNCSGTLPAPVAWQYYPGDPTTTFPPPTQAIPTCAPAMTTPYEKSIAGCIETPIACSSTANVDTSNYGNNRNRETERAVNCLTHANTNQGDQVDPADANAPFQFLAGNDNPIAGLAGNDVMVSDSLVTVPVFDVGSFNTSGTNFQIVGFVQLFLNPNGAAAPGFGPNRGHVNTTIINMAGCGTGASGTPILGNGASPVAVRLISP